MHASQRLTVWHNNYSISLIEAGNYNDGRTKLSRALRTHRDNMDHVAGENPEQFSKQVEDDSFREDCEDQDGYHLYRRAIHMSANVKITYRACIMVSSVITFNLVLATQELAAPTDGREDSTL